MAFELDVPESIGGSSGYLEVGGKYHATVSVVHEEKMPGKATEDGGFEKLLPGGFSVTMEVLAGEQADKKFSLVFWGPDFSKDLKHEDNEEIRRKHSAFALACDLIKPDTLGKKVIIDLQDAVGSQVVVEVKVKEYPRRDGGVGKSIVLVGKNIYHVDDPRAKGAVMNEKLLASYPAENRHDPSYFVLPEQAKRKQSASSPASPSTTRVSDADLDDI